MGEGDSKTTCRISQIPIKISQGPHLNPSTSFNIHSYNVKHVLQQDKSFFYLFSISNRGLLQENKAGVKPKQKEKKKVYQTETMFDPFLSLAAAQFHILVSHAFLTFKQHQHTHTQS